MFFLGKTHTMTGGKDGEMRGIIPRSVEQIIQQVMLMRSNGWEIVVTTSMVRSLTDPESESRVNAKKYY